MLTPIVCDHLGTPKELVREDGTLLWAADHDLWGSVRSVRGPIVEGDLALASPADPLTVPIRFQGQWEDGCVPQG